MNLNANLKKKIDRFSEIMGIGYTWQALRFGYYRAVCDFDNVDAFASALKAAQRLKGVSIQSTCHYQGQFDGTIYIMDAQEAAELEQKLREEKKQNEAWWQRYHNADEPTRAKMRSGEIA